MTAKEFLMQYRNADDEINSHLDEIHRLRSLAAKTTHVMSHDRPAQSEGEDRLASIVARIADMEREVDDEIDRLDGIKRTVQRAIASVPDARLRKVLTLRYIGGKRWEQIAVDMDKQYRWILRLHGRALQEIEKIIFV